jgi:hypothetical protein
MKAIIVLVLIGIIFWFLYPNRKPDPEITLVERYPAPWREEFDVGITKTLISKGIRGCGQYKYRESSKDRNEYLVHCTGDGKLWVAYFVWSATERVMGPYSPDPSL